MNEASNLLPIVEKDKTKVVSIYSFSNASFLCTMGLINFLTGTMASIFAPFFPSHAEKYYHASPVAIGLVFTLFPFTICASSPFVASVCQKFGRYCVLVFGVLVLSFFSILLGYVPTIELVLAVRIFQGIGASAISKNFIKNIVRVTYNRAYKIDVASLGIMLEKFPDNALEVSAFVEGLYAGIGYVFGPIIGSLLFNWGGFSCVFLVVALLLLSLLIPTHFVLYNMETPDCPKPDKVDRLTPKAVGFRDVLNRTTICGFILASVSISSISFTEPYLEVYLKMMLDLNVTEIGLVFAWVGLVYTITCQYITNLVNYFKDPVLVMTIGYVFMSISLVIIGPPPFLFTFFDSYLWAMLSQLVGLTCACIACAMAFVPTMSVIQSSVVDLGPEGLDCTMGLFSSAIFFGEGLGPVVLSMFKAILPETPVVNCSRLKNASTCVSSIPWATFCFACFIAITGVLVLPLIRQRKTANA